MNFPRAIFPPAMERFRDSTCTPSASLFARRTGVDIKRRRLVLAASDTSTDRWPARTGELCARCLQPFDAVPWPRPPISFDARARVYHCAGFLCGPRCYKALVLERSHGGRREWADEIALSAVARDYFGVELGSVAPAPPLEMLAVLYADELAKPGAMPDAARRAALALYRGDDFVCERARALPFVRVTFFCEMALADDAEQRARQANAAAVGMRVPVDQTRVIRRSDQPATQQMHHSRAASTSLFKTPVRRAPPRSIDKLMMPQRGAPVK